MTHSEIQGLLDLVAEAYPAYSQRIAENRQRNQVVFDELADFALTAARGVLGEATIEDLAHSYALFVTEVNREHLRYCLRGQYRNKSYKEVYDSVYDNDSYMRSYHWGVFATTFLWEHHLKLYEFFTRRFLAGQARDAKSFLDLGSGSGLWSLIATRSSNERRSQGVDISKSSLVVAESLSRAVGLQDRSQFVIGNALEYSLPDPADAGMSCFLLEHLEDPRKLLENLARNVRPGAPCFITAAVTAAEIDHIFEFASEGEVVLMAEEAGFRVCEVLSGVPPSDMRNQFLPRSVGIIMVRRTTTRW